MTLAESLRRDMEILTEAQDYPRMFDQIIKFNGGNKIPVIDSAIYNARVVLKKEDRIVWFLRWFRLLLVEQYLGFAEINKSPESWTLSKEDTEKYFTSLSNEMAKKIGTSVQTVTADISNYTPETFVSRFLNKMEHFLSLPIHAIQSYVFGYQPTGDVIVDFQKWEEEWQKEADGAFEDEDSEVILDFHNGWKWMNTNKAYCSKEADAMGHCGNSPRQHSSDNLLSLRKEIKRGDTTLYKPYLTFILDSNGFLGEMKGRFNEKPEAKFHPMIVALLKQDFIKGIKGGGYLPSHNFSLNDLDSSEKKELLAEKPELGDLYQMYKKYGIKSKKVMEMLENALDDRGITTEELVIVDDDTMKIGEWMDVEGFLTDFDEQFLQKLYNIATGDNEATVDQIDSEDIFDIVDHMSEHSLERLANHFNMNIPNDTLGRRRALLKITEKIENEHYLYDELLDIIFENSFISSSIRQKAKERLLEYFEKGFSFVSYHVFINKIDNLDSKVELFIRIDDLVQYASVDDDDDDYGDYFDYFKIRGEAWEAIDTERTIEYWLEEGLIEKCSASEGHPSPGYRKYINDKMILDGELSANFDPITIGQKLSQRL